MSVALQKTYGFAFGYPKNEFEENSDDDHFQVDANEGHPSKWYFVDSYGFFDSEDSIAENRGFHGKEWIRLNVAGERFPSVEEMVELDQETIDSDDDDWVEIEGISLNKLWQGLFSYLRTKAPELTAAQAMFICKVVFNGFGDGWDDHAVEDMRDMYDGYLYYSVEGGHMRECRFWKCPGNENFRDFGEPISHFGCPYSGMPEPLDGEADSYVLESFVGYSRLLALGNETEGEDDPSSFDEMDFEPDGWDKSEIIGYFVVPFAEEDDLEE